MSKATPAQLQNMGFHGSQFGDTDESGFTAYLQLVLDDAATIVEERVTSAVYAASVSGINFVRIQRAERYFAAADLWRRREQYEASEATTAGDSEGAKTIDSRNLANAEKFLAYADEEISKITGDDADSTDASGISITSVESGSYPLESET